MDPLTAVGLASNVMQMAGVAIKIVKTVRDVATDGAREETVEIQRQTKELQAFCVRLGASDLLRQSQSPEDQELQQLCLEANKVSSQLLSVIEPLVLTGSSVVSWRALGIAIKEVWKSSEMQALQERLDRIEKRAHTLITMTYGERMLRRLGTLEKAVSNIGMNNIISEELNDIRQQLRRHHSTKHAMVVSIASRGREMTAELLILQQLRFPEMKDRFADLSKRPAHEGTFSWMTNAASGKSTHSNARPNTFLSWLSSSEKQYWITGKPGSGKSTLMRFLQAQPETSQALSSWAGSDSLITANYFFWDLGKSELLHSQEGLLRALLFQVLQQRPGLIQYTYPQLWRMYNFDSYGNESLLDEFDGVDVPLDVESLIWALQRACIAAAQSNTCFCFFIDALDEYHGQPKDIIALVKTIHDMPKVKMCMSSRPENAFVSAYEAGQYVLYLEKFNFDDINTHVRDTLYNDKMFQCLDDKDTAGEELVKYIVTEARGVFLWVRLVLEDVKQFLQDGFGLGVIADRVGQLPKDLEPYFTQILDRIAEEYRAQAATVLLATLHAHAPLPTLSYWFMTEGPGDLDADRPIQKLTIQQSGKRRDDTKRRINACSKGLLEVVHYVLPRDLDSLPASILFSQRVNFLHRTMREFLTLENTHARLMQWQYTDVNVNEVICKSVLCQIRVCPTHVDFFGIEGPIAMLLNVFAVHVEHLHKEFGKGKVARDLRQKMVSTLEELRQMNGHKLPETIDTLTHTTTSTGTSSKPSLSMPTRSGKEHNRDRSRGREISAKIRNMFRDLTMSS